MPPPINQSQERTLIGRAPLALQNMVSQVPAGDRSSLPHFYVEPANGVVTTLVPAVGGSKEKKRVLLSLPPSSAVEQEWHLDG